MGPFRAKALLLSYPCSSHGLKAGVISGEQVVRLAKEGTYLTKIAYDTAFSSGKL
jgi:hypothetical protein